MSITIIVLIVEVIIILLAVVGLLFFLRWKRKKTQTTELDILLDNVVSHEEERAAQLNQFLQENYALEKESAQECTSYMIEVEKQFLQAFIKQQIEQTSVTDFYQNLCELLDQYLSFVPAFKAPSLNASTENTEPKIDDVEEEIAEETDENAAVEAEETSETASDDNEVATNDKAENEEALLEDQEVADSKKNKSEKEQQLKEDTKDTKDTKDTEEEIDWGDAFAESGDQMDEATKTDFESEKETKTS